MINLHFNLYKIRHFLAAFRHFRLTTHTVGQNASSLLVHRKLVFLLDCVQRRNKSNRLGFHTHETASLISNRTLCGVMMSFKKAVGTKKSIKDKNDQILAYKGGRDKVGREIKSER